MCFSPTWDKCDKFCDYCSTYQETTIFPPSLWAQVPSDTRRTNNGLEFFHRHFNALFTSPHPTFLFFWDEIVKQQTVTYITMSDLKTIAPITYCWTQTTATPLPSPTEVPTTALLSSRQQFLRAVGYSYTLWYTIYSNRRVSETFTAECIVFTLKVCIATCLWCWYFSCRTLFCDFGLFLCDFGCLRSN